MVSWKGNTLQGSTNTWKSFVAAKGFGDIPQTQSVLSWLAAIVAPPAHQGAMSREASLMSSSLLRWESAAWGLTVCWTVWV